MAIKNTKPFAVKGMNITTQKGEAVWCKVVTPDRMYNEHGDLSTSLACDPDDPAVAAFVERLEELRDTAYSEAVETFGPAKGKQVKVRDVFTEEFDKEGNPTGKIIFKAKLKDIDIRKEKGDQCTITVVDAKRNPMKTVPLVGNGSIVRLVVYANPYYMANTKEVGISMIWTKMQIIELVEFNGGGADGFDDEDGFEAAASDDSMGSEDDF